MGLIADICFSACADRMRNQLKFIKAAILSAEKSIKSSIQHIEWIQLIVLAVEI